MKRITWVCYLDGILKGVWNPDGGQKLDSWKYIMKTCYPACRLVKGTLDFKLGK